MEYQPMISVVMPAYNCERFIGAAIESVLSQTYTNLELLVIDDCSRDSTAAIAEKYAEQDHRVHVLRNAVNQGVSKTRNRGIDEAQGEYIAFLDSDDIWDQSKLEKQLRVACDRKADIVYSSYGFIDEDGKQIKKPYFVPDTTDFNEMLKVSVIGCSTAMIRSDVFGNSRFRADVHHEDYAMWMELLSKPVAAHGCTDVLMYYRQVRGSRNENKLHAAIERWKVYRQVLNLGLCRSVYSLLCYSIAGIAKYYRK